MTFSYNAVWEDTLALLRRHGPLLAAIAGVFLFLPALLFAVFLQPPEPETRDAQALFQVMTTYWTMAAPWVLAQILVSTIGSIAMLRLVFATNGTVGEALVFALLLLPFYVLLSICSTLIIGIGFILLIVPGIYLIGRIAPAPAVMVAETRRNPIAAIQRSFEITKGRGWHVLGLIFVVGVVGSIVIGTAGTLAGLVFRLAAGLELGKLLTGVVTSALNAAFGTLFVMLYAAIYRALTAPEKVAETFA